MSKLIKIEQADDDLHQELMGVMEAYLNEQGRPKVGIFWYSPQIKDVFGVLAKRCRRTSKDYRKERCKLQRTTRKHMEKEKELLQ